MNRKPRPLADTTLQRDRTAVFFDDLARRRQTDPRSTFALGREEQIENLCLSIKSTLKEMIDEGGRSQETNLLGEKGRYHEKVSKLTLNKPCPVCGVEIEKASYMGGAIYYCNQCQES